MNSHVNPITNRASSVNALTVIAIPTSHRHPRRVPSMEDKKKKEERSHLENGAKLLVKLRQGFARASAFTVFVDGRLSVSGIKLVRDHELAYKQ
jgi:hypothetical protein